MNKHGRIGTTTSGLCGRTSDLAWKDNFKRTLDGKWMANWEMLSIADVPVHPVAELFMVVAIGCILVVGAAGAVKDVANVTLTCPTLRVVCIACESRTVPGQTGAWALSIVQTLYTVPLGFV